jgi:uncharacterized membrane protein YkvI
LHLDKKYICFSIDLGNVGILGIIVCSIIISFIIYKSLKIIYKYQITNYKEFLNKILNGKKLNNIINIIVNIFLCITFFIMISGFGAYLKQEFRN